MTEQLLNTGRPDRRAGNCVNRRNERPNQQPSNRPEGRYERKDNTSAYRGRLDSNRKPYQRDQSTTREYRPKQTDRRDSRNDRRDKPQKPKVIIPPFMKPFINETVQHRFTTFEDGGAFAISNDICTRGNSKIVLSPNGTPKRPIYVYAKKKFSVAGSHKRSMLFYIHNGDMVISESHMIGESLDKPSFISVFIFRAVYGQFEPKHPRYDLIARISKRLETTEGMMKYGISSSNPAIMKIVRDQLYDSHIENLTELVGRAIDKSNSPETSYTYYHNSKLADEMKSVCAQVK